jgi:hypothetical protein
MSDVLRPKPPKNPSIPIRSAPNYSQSQLGGVIRRSLGVIRSNLMIKKCWYYIRPTCERDGIAEKAQPSIRMKCHLKKIRCRGESNEHNELTFGLN